MPNSAPRTTGHGANYYRLISLAAVGVALAAWLTLSFAGLLDPNRLPPAQVLWETLVELLRDGYASTPFWRQVVASLGRALSGFALAVIIGVPVGIWIGTHRWFDAVVTPFFTFLRPIPPIALVPLFIFYFGIGEVSKIALIFLTAFLYLTVNTASGVRSVPEDLILASKSLGLTGRQIFFHVILPAASASILTGMRIAMTLSWALVVAAELIAAQVGLGYMIMDATTFYRIPVVYVGIVTIGLIGLVLEAALLMLEQRLLHWRGKQ
jgi:ABC-type nitrate/sulfonate/bicarbonate transport system permease component